MQLLSNQQSQVVNDQLKALQNEILQLNDQLSSERQSIEALKTDAIEKAQELANALKTIEDDQVKLSEASLALKKAESSGRGYQEKFDAQKPLI